MPKKRNLKKCKYRSKFEASTAKFLRANKVKFQYEPLTLDYVIVHKYKPDFVLGNGVFIETKGRFTSRDRTKMLQVQLRNPNVDIRFCFMADNFLYKGSNTRYSEWCKDNGFKYCIKEIPRSWLT